MSLWLRQLALCFSAGAAGALVRALVAWACARHGWDNPFGVNYSGALANASLYPRIVWGGLWAFLFLLPLARDSWTRGLIWGFVVTLVQLVVLPLLQHAGVHFALLPALATLLLNFVWGLTVALLLRAMA